MLWLSTTSIIIRSWYSKTFLSEGGREFWQSKDEDGELICREADTVLSWEHLAVFLVVLAEGD